MSIDARYSPKITTALHQVMSKVGYVQKQGRNDFQKYNYAGEGHFLAALRPEMVLAGLLLIPSGKIVQGIDEFGNVFVEMEYTLAHKDGDVWPDKITMPGAGNDKNSKGGVGDKGLYKAMTGANKYLLSKLFQMETGDDPERDSDHDPGTRGVNDNPQQRAPTPVSTPRTIELIDSSGVSHEFDKASQWITALRYEADKLGLATDAQKLWDANCDVLHLISEAAADRKDQHMIEATNTVGKYLLSKLGVGGTG